MLNSFVFILILCLIKYSFDSNRCIGGTIGSFAPCIKNILGFELIFLDQVFDNFQLAPSNLALIGFSQGCMMAIQVGLKRKERINCLIGYSGKVINQKHLSDNIKSKPKIFLMHGANDTIVSPTHLLEAKEYLNKYGLKIKTKLFKNCDHVISVEGSSLGLDFLRKNLL